MKFLVPLLSAVALVQGQQLQVTRIFCSQMDDPPAGTNYQSYQLNTQAFAWDQCINFPYGAASFQLGVGEGVLCNLFAEPGCQGNWTYNENLGGSTFEQCYDSSIGWLYSGYCIDVAAGSS